MIGANDSTELWRLPMKFGSHSKSVFSFIRLNAAQNIWHKSDLLSFKSQARLFHTSKEGVLLLKYHFSQTAKEIKEI